MGRFFKDLTDERFTTPFAIYHRRFSTNTVPKWPLAQPMRFLGHNGAFGWAAGCSSRTAGCSREFGMAMKCTAADEIQAIEVLGGCLQTPAAGFK